MFVGMPVMFVVVAVAAGEPILAEQPNSPTPNDVPPAPPWVPPTVLDNMNGDYLISKSSARHTTGATFSTRFKDYTAAGSRPTQYFDVYSPPIRTHYGQVYWTMMEKVPLDPSLVQRFDGKTIAVVGYEADQVFHTPAGKPERSVPINWAYNHHYEAYLLGKHATMEKIVLTGEADSRFRPSAHQLAPRAGMEQWRLRSMRQDQAASAQSSWRRCSD